LSGRGTASEEVSRGTNAPDPDILSGTPVFVGTRLPVQTLLDYLEAADSLNEFLDHFPSVSREQAVAALERAKEMLITHADTA
jgi:uncharacterized protein (DUF433 family)